MRRRNPSALLLAAMVVWPVSLSRAAGPHGVDDGWAIDNSGRPLLTPAKAQKLSEGGTGWVRIGMRRIPGHND